MERRNLHKIEQQYRTKAIDRHTGKNVDESYLICKRRYRRQKDWIYYDLSTERCDLLYKVNEMLLSCVYILLSDFSVTVITEVFARNGEKVCNKSNSK